MYRISFLLIAALNFAAGCVSAQKQVPPPAAAVKENMHPEKLWMLGRVSGIGITNDGREVVYRVSTPDMDKNTFTRKLYASDIQTGTTRPVETIQGLVADKHISPDGRYAIASRPVLMENTAGKKKYPDLPLSQVQLYDALDYRHWDTWHDGSFNHLFFGPADKPDSTYRDIMAGEPFHCPQKPFGGEEDYAWSPDGKSIVYVSKKKKGTEYVQSTNTDIYRYDLSTGKTFNLTEKNKGYDTHPLFSVQGDMAYLSMETDGYEADKNDLIVLSQGVYYNLTARWDGTVNSFIWHMSGKKLYFTAPVDGTIQVFEVPFAAAQNDKAMVRQITNGDFDVTAIIGLTSSHLLITRTDLNHAAEIYSYALDKGEWRQLSRVNDALYGNTASCATERRYINTTDGKKMLAWVVYPPDFDPKKKYPTLLYCQGGPQSALTQFYSFRWNLSLMASQGYIVVAPNRRGMPGHGVEWNRQISGDWGGQNMQDYLAAIDDISKETYVDKTRLGAVGASYGGYSVFYLAGIHNKRFKTFIAHDGIFNTQSMYGTTEEMFFVNFDLGGPYWEEKNKKSFTDFNPSSFVAKWDTPILIIQGGKDYRVPEGQAQEAFTAAQVRGIKSRFMYLPEENHWVIQPQNSLVWQREFFRWLKETL
jgi:dipeptidyl aminopeptidase/acylaminoacyl peptidase